MGSIYKNLLNIVSVIVIVFMIIMGFLGDLLAETLGIPVAPAIIGSSVLGIPLGILAILLYSKTKK